MPKLVVVTINKNYGFRDNGTQNHLYIYVCGDKLVIKECQLATYTVTNYTQNLKFLSSYTTMGKMWIFNLLNLLNICFQIKVKPFY